MINTLIKRGFRSNSIANKKMDLKSFFSLSSFHKKFNKFLVENFTSEKKEKKTRKVKNRLVKSTHFMPMFPLISKLSSVLRHLIDLK